MSTYPISAGGGDDTALAVPSSPAVKESLRLNAARRAIAKNMVRSVQEAPHFFVTVDVDMSRALEARDAWKATGDPSASVNDFILWAAARTLPAFPLLNSTLDGDQLTIFSDVNVGMVVTLGDKLIVPVVRGADKLDVVAIGQVSRGLVSRAREKKLLPAESEGGTFSVSNLGMHGVDQFTAIINPGQAAILAVGRVVSRVVALENVITVRPTASLTLSVDHRIADGIVAAKFLADVKKLLENFDFAPPGP